MKYGVFFVIIFGFLVVHAVFPAEYRELRRPRSQEVPSTGWFAGAELPRREPSEMLEVLAITNDVAELLKSTKFMLTDLEPKLDALDQKTKSYVGRLFMSRQDKEIYKNMILGKEWEKLNKKLEALNSLLDQFEAMRSSRQIGEKARLYMHMWELSIVPLRRDVIEVLDRIENLMSRF